MLTTPGLPDKIRAFVAVRMSIEVEQSLSRLIDALRALHSGIRWVRIANLHLTLRFLGDAADTRLVAALGDDLTDIAARTAPFELAVRGTGAFPSLARPRTLWLGLLSDELLRLAEQIERAAVSAGFRAEVRPYSPHLTIGRVRDLRGWPPIRHQLEQASAHDFGTSAITEVILYRSILGGDGSQYVEMGRYHLSGAAVQ